MKDYFLLPIMLLMFAAASSQQKQNPVLPDMDRLMKMTPEEQKKYAAEMQKQLSQQAQQLAKQANIKFDASALPGADLKMPVKDLKRLAMIPPVIPTRQQLLSQVSKMEAGLKKIIEPKINTEIENFSASASIQQIQQASAGGFYRDQPQASLLLGIKAAQKQPANPNNWNNLAALLNMNKMEQYAVPILQNLLENNPNSSIILNNLGQAFLGLGDLLKASENLQKCLVIDPLHPEANRSMGMIKTYMNDLKAAEKYFEKEFHIAHRKSSFAQINRNGSRKNINLARLRKAKMRADGIQEKDFFSEINLAVFKIPDLPENSDETSGWFIKNQGFMESLQKELLFWNNASIVTEEENRQAGKRNPGVYQDLVNELLSDLGDQFAPILGLVDEQEAAHLEQLTNAYYKKQNETVCPTPPSDPENFALIQKEYREKCCKIKKPITDEYIQAYNASITARISIVQSRWKEYINGMINIVSLDPSIANKKMVYGTVAEYFTFLIGATQSATFISGPMECDTKLSEADLRQLESNRAASIECPSWLKINFSLYVAKISADCEAFRVEADIHKFINVGIEKKFATGTSTLYIGAGVDGSFFKEILSTGVSQQFYIVFDNNNQFADLGMRGSGSFDIANGLFGEEFTYDFSMSSGFDSNLEAKSEWVEKWEKAIGYLPQ